MYRSSCSYLQMQSGPGLGLKKSSFMQYVVYRCGVRLYCLLRRLSEIIVNCGETIFILTVTRRGICEDLFLTYTGSGTAIDPKDDLETRITTVLNQIQDPRQRQNACSACVVALLYRRCTISIGPTLYGSVLSSLGTSSVGHSPE